MHIWRKRLTMAPLLGVVLIGAACTDTFRGAPPVIGSEGPMIMPAPGAVGQVNLFFDAAKAAYASPEDSTAALRMVTNGFGLIYSNCNEYFRDAGKTQRILIFSRDLLGMIGTLATGVIAISHASKDATAIAALITTTGYAVIDKRPMHERPVLLNENRRIKSSPSRCAG